VSEIKRNFSEVKVGWYKCKDGYFAYVACVLPEPHNEGCPVIGFIVTDTDHLSFMWLADGSDSELAGQCSLWTYLGTEKPHYEFPRKPEVKTHDLKILSKYYEQVFLGHKKAEFRYNDRDFKVGDHLVLREITEDKEFTGAFTTVEVTDMTDCSKYVEAPWVMLSFRIISSVSTPRPR